MSCTAACAASCGGVGLVGCLAGCLFGAGITSAPGGIGSIVSATASATVTGAIID